MKHYIFNFLSTTLFRASTGGDPERISERCIAYSVII